MIVEKEFLNREAAEEIFNRQAVYLSGVNVIPCYRVAEIFGEWVKDFIWKNRKNIDHNAWGNCHERPMIYYLYKSGFMKVVEEINYLLMVDEIQEKGISGELVE